MVPSCSATTAAQAAAEAIMTTDTVAKQASYADEGWSVGGMAKGAACSPPAWPRCSW